MYKRAYLLLKRIRRHPNLLTALAPDHPPALSTLTPLLKDLLGLAQFVLSDSSLYDAHFVPVSLLLMFQLIHFLLQLGRLGLQQLQILHVALPLIQIMYLLLQVQDLRVVEQGHGWGYVVLC